MPFYAKKRSQIVNAILSGHYYFIGKRWRQVSSQAKGFVENLLVVDPDNRATADEALQHSWLNCRQSPAARMPCMEEIQTVASNIKKFASYCRLQQLALMVVAHKSSSAEIGILRKVFQQHDTDGNGVLDYEEFKAALQLLGHKDEDYQEIFDSVDLDGTGVIRYTEFLAAAQGDVSEERLAEAFDRLDSDDSGYISAENLIDILGHDISPSEIDAILKEVSQNGMVSYSDFLALWDERDENVANLLPPWIKTIQAS